MAKCDACGTTILMGGKKEGALRFCNDKCFHKGKVIRFAHQIPEDLLETVVARVHHEEPCPKCQGSGPVDIHTSHSVWSAFYLSSWKSTPEMCCRSCGVKSQTRGLLFSLFLGWWGVPWGLLVTPLQIGRNITGMLRPPSPDQPSEKLRQFVRLDLAQQVVDSHAKASAAPVPPIAEPFGDQGPLPQASQPSPFSHQDAFKS